MATFYTTFWHVREFELAEATREEEAQDKLSKSAVLESMFANVLDFLFASRAIEKENMRVAKAVWIGRAEHRHNVSLLLECGIKRTIVHVRSHSWNRLRFCVWGFIGRCLR